MKWREIKKEIAKGANPQRIRSMCEDLYRTTDSFWLPDEMLEWLFRNHELETFFHHVRQERPGFLANALDDFLHECAPKVPHPERYEIVADLLAELCDEARRLGVPLEWADGDLTEHFRTTIAEYYQTIGAYDKAAARWKENAELASDDYTRSEFERHAAECQSAAMAGRGRDAPAVE